MTTVYFFNFAEDGYAKREFLRESEAFCFARKLANSGYCVEVENRSGEIVASFNIVENPNYENDNGGIYAVNPF